MTREPPIDVADEFVTNPQSATDALSAVPAGSEVVIVPAVGAPAEIAATLLRERGYDVSTLACRRP